MDDFIVWLHNVKVSFRTVLGTSYALDGVTFKIPRGKVLGVVGESGCGKSVTGYSILQIVPPPGKMNEGEIWFKPLPDSQPVNLLSYKRESPEIRTLRGREIGMIFQEPMTSLNPCYTVGDQITEALKLHLTNKEQIRHRVHEILQKVELPNPEKIARFYPHQLSGGMRQRVMIAIALSCRPQLLIADEPTTALDVTTEAQILSLIRNLQQEINMSVMYITHNMGVIAQLSDRVVVMYLGKVVEDADAKDLFYDPKHPYTISLLRSIPRLGIGHGEKLESIQGVLPDPYTRLPGCPFHPRCPSFIPGICDRLEPPETVLKNTNDHLVRCHYYPAEKEPWL
jgi:peptide/nickel transport system ATP-binding protein